MRIGLLSTANINQMILAGASASDRVEVVAVGSRDLARAQAYAREHGLARAHGSYEELLADDDLDAVYISLPNSLHHEWTLRALAAGRHVLCEKPYSKRPPEVEEAFEAAERAGLVLMEAFMYRHHPQTHRVAELVADRLGGFGEVVSRVGLLLADEHPGVRTRAVQVQEVRLPAEEVGQEGAEVGEDAGRDRGVGVFVLRDGLRDGQVE